MRAPPHHPSQPESPRATITSSRSRSRSRSSTTLPLLLSLLLLATAPAPAAAVAQAAASTPFSFLTIGDWGAGTDNQTAVAATMAQYARRVPVQMVLALGDNIYETGVESTTDPLWDERYCGVYTDPALDVPWFAILGNHDHYGGHPEAQIEYYSQSIDPAGRWVMPDFFYTRSWADVGGGKSLQVVFIDTVLLAQEAFYASFKREVAAGLASPTSLDRWRRSSRLLENRKVEGWKWVNATLAASTADWLIVAGHFPVYSAGDHGDTPELKRRLKPLLEAHGVDAYLCGHDHVLEYLRDTPEEQHLEGAGLAYFVSGSGGQHVYGLTPTPETRFAVQESGFMVHTFAPDGSSMTVDIVQRDGPILKSVTLPLRRNRKQPEQQQPAAAAAAVAAVAASSISKGTASGARLRALQE